MGVRVFNQEDVEATLSQQMDQAVLAQEAEKKLLKAKKELEVSRLSEKEWERSGLQPCRVVSLSRCHSCHVVILVTPEASSSCDVLGKLLLCPYVDNA